MRRDGLSMMVLTTCVALAACQQQPKQSRPDAGKVGVPADAEVADAALAHVDSLREALAQQQQDAGGPRIAWIDPGKSSTAEAGVGIRRMDAEGSEPSSRAADRPAPKPTAAEGYGILLDHIGQQQQLTPLGRAAAAVTLTSAMPWELLDDGALVSPLRGYERDAIERYRHVVRALHARVISGSAMDRTTVLGELEAMFEHAPIRMRAVKLCQRVRGFGSYDEADATALLAGREHRMIAYVELEDYRAMPALGPDGQFEVKLSQEIELFNEADGLAVWRVEPVQIVDHCRNQRRDFFVVQLIKLPPRLSVGRYLMKIRVTDQHGGSVDERTIPIAVVADAAMVQGK
jgi:hypothetical protein